jgi:histidine ammonia-lyase
MQPSAGSTQTLCIGEGALSIEAVVSHARHATPLRLAPSAHLRLEASVTALANLLQRGAEVYGVTTGFGDSSQTQITPEQRVELAHNLVRYHGCGTGPFFSPEQCRAIVLARLACLVQGYSAVRPVVLQRLIDLLNAGLVPAIAAQGSVGASGDLTPLSYVAAALLGEREVHWQGGIEPIAPHLQRLGLRALQLQPKESLALMNGTSAMTGLACLAFARTQRLARWCAALSAMCCDAISGHVAHFAERLFALKPHPGQVHAARWIRQDVRGEPAPAQALPEATRGQSAATPPNVPYPAGQSIAQQDRYSLRCSPHVIGACLDFLPLARQWIETELNSVNDNPLLDGETLYHGGHFYGGHICLAMDTLKNTVANLADLLDRQLLLVCDPRTNRGLPANLVAAQGPNVHHGFKAMQITSSALAVEAAKLALPASIFSRSTENHNQDKVSLGTIAARDCLQLLELCETIAAIATLTLTQACELRGVAGCGLRAQAMHARVRQSVTFNQYDRRMDGDITSVLGAYANGALPIGEVDYG